MHLSNTNQISLPTFLMRTFWISLTSTVRLLLTRPRDIHRITMRLVSNMVINLNVVLVCHGTSFVDDLGVVHVKRSDPWITSYNSAIATSIRSNHDISWVPTSTKALALVHYLTNYATKADISPQQMLLKAALLAESKERLESNSGDNISSQDTKFLLRWYNSLAHDQEISGVQIASHLLRFRPIIVITTVLFTSVCGA